MSASPDPELVRLLDAYADEIFRDFDQDEIDAARDAVLAYLAEHFVPRGANRPPPSPPGSYTAARGILPWKPGDELPEERIRRLRDGTAGGEG